MTLGEENVAGLDVPMDHTTPVGIVECFGNFAGQPQRLGNGKPALAVQPVAQ